MFVVANGSNIGGGNVHVSKSSREYKIGVGAKMSQEISNQSKDQADERYQDGQSPFWKGFLGHLGNKRPDHQFLNLCKGKFPGHRSKQSEEESDGQVSQEHHHILEVGPVHGIILGYKEYDY